MDSNPTDKPGRSPLNGWKEIGAYLGKSVRSAQRWEMTLGLPVHRIKTPDGQIVYADPDEIDTWRRQLAESPRANGEEGTEADDEPIAPIDASSVAMEAAAHRSTRWRLLFAGMVLFAAGAVSAWWFGSPAHIAVELKYVGRTIEAIGRQGELVWTHRFDSDVSPPVRSPAFVDLDGDGESEVLVPVRRSSRGAGPAMSDALFCFSRTGRLIWSVAPNRTLSFGGRAFSAPWDLRDFVVAVTPPPRVVWIAYAHHTWFPGFVVQVDARGNQALKYVQAGALYSIAHWMTPAGGYLAVGGGSNEQAHATIALIPDESPPSTFPSTAAKFVCDDCAQLTPSRILFFEAAELALANHEMVPYVQALRVVGASLKATVADGPGRSVAIVNPDFSVDAIQFGQRYWAAHRDLELKGRIQHDRDDCPERSTPRQMREWTPEGRWRTWSVMPSDDDH